MHLIQQALDEAIFDRITNLSTAKEAWEYIQKEYSGLSKVISVRRQALRQRFEVLQMEESENVQQYITRVVSIVNQIKGLGYTLSDEEVVSKVLRSLTPKYDFVVTVIEEARDIEKLTLDELSGSLQAYEPRVLRYSERPEEKTLFARGNSRDTEEWEASYGRGRGGPMRGRWRSNSRGRGRGMFVGGKTFRADQGSQFSDQRSIRENLRNVQCYHCKKFGHVQSNCWFKDRNIEEGSSSTSNKNTGEELGSLFMVHTAKDTSECSIWLLDRCCSSHITERKELFYNLDESQKHVVRLGDNKEMKVAGRGTVAITTQEGETKLIHNVQYVANLAHNLQSVGQLVTNGYHLVFESGRCKIMDAKNGTQLMVVKQSRNNLFPVEFSRFEQTNTVISSEEESIIWHNRYGHLNFQGLQVLNQKQMVVGLPKIKQFNSCEGCIYGKLSRQSFPSRRSWRAKKKTTVGSLRYMWTNASGFSWRKQVFLTVY